MIRDFYDAKEVIDDIIWELEGYMDITPNKKLQEWRAQLVKVTNFIDSRYPEK